MPIKSSNDYLRDNIISPGDRALFGGGYTTGASTTIDYFNISQNVNSITFGNLTQARYAAGAVSNSINGKGCFAGGDVSNSPQNVIDYITILSPGNALDFGDLTQSKIIANGVSNGINNRGVWGGGGTYSAGWIPQNVIEYINIAWNTGNALDFGDISIARYYLGGFDNNVNNRGVFSGGCITTNYSTYNIIEYITITTTGNSIYRGDLTQYRSIIASASNGINNRGISAGGYYPLTPVYYNIIDYITITTIGNAIDFGDLTATKYCSGTANGTNNRMAMTCSYDGSVNSNVIENLVIPTPANSVNFGALTNNSRRIAGALSNA